MSEDFDRRGAEAKVRFGTLFGHDIVVKEREPKAYRIGELDLSLRQSRTKAEARALITAARHGAYVPQVLHAGQFALIMERMPGRTLKDTKASPSTYKEIGMTLASIHSAGIAHGDFTPANVIIHKGRPAVIDFGLAVFSRDPEEMAIDLLLMKRSIGEQMFGHVLSGYQAHERWKEVHERMLDIDQRGRYKLRTEDDEQD
jgi:Kae1-associated kinase Bud32